MPANSLRIRMTHSERNQFRQSLLAWFLQHKRDLPWRRTKDPYAIWISEIMLQQTRVAAAIPYYERFLRRFPNVASLALAPEADLLAHWAGLGYYYRARNLQKAAQAICRNHAQFPSDYDTILQLPGVGAYTAAAIASICFDRPHAVLDGNVFRVLSRLFDDATNIAAAPARQHFAALADSLLDPQRPGDFNQAMMELGATTCLPKNPQCLICPVSNHCRGREAGHQTALPVKTVKRKTAEEERRVFWIERGDQILLWQRSPMERLMPGFWELPESTQLPEGEGESVGSFRHAITFHNYRFIVCRARPPADIGPCQWVPLLDLGNVPVSTIVQKARKLIQRLTPTSPKSSPSLRDAPMKLHT